MEDLVYFFLDAGDVFGLILQGGFPGFVFALIVVSLTLIGLNFSGKFADANEELIKANPTTISNKVIFQITGVIYFILVTGYVVMSLISVPDMAEYFGFGEAIVTLLISLFTAIVLEMHMALHTATQSEIRTLIFGWQFCTYQESENKKIYLIKRALH